MKIAKEGIDRLLAELKKARTAEDRKNKFQACLSAMKELEIDLTGRRGKITFKRTPGEGQKGELRFRNRLLGLRTIPLEDESYFIALHAEAGVYRMNRSGRYSADLLGLFRSPRTTRFGVAELKYGSRGDHLLYATAEGLINIVLHYQGLERLHRGWAECKKDPVTKNAWGQGNPFAGLTKKSIQLLIVGDHSWMEKQRQILDHVHVSTPVNFGASFPKIEIAVYSSNKGARYNSKPYALLPLQKIK